MTTVLFVNEIESSLGFWREGLGFEVVAEVPHGERLGFVILVREKLEVMLQSWASLEEDLPGVAGKPRGESCLIYLDVAGEFERVVERLKEWPVVVEKRQTFYGKTEVGFLAPSGHTVLVAA